jgi:regulation of enolase protein 1 (concanavalin A-like superfamily)
LRIFTALAITSVKVTSDTSDWAIIVTLAHRDSGITSVGLNAVALVKERRWPG